MRRESLYAYKRLIDTVGSAGLLLVCSPLFAAIAVAIKLDSPGPVFYRSPRVGKDGRRFHMLKFRSMWIDADEKRHLLQDANYRDDILFKVQDDPRITRGGRFLRKYSLDELPQLWNVLRQEMSLVGPRPPLSSEVEHYGPAELRRLSVPQGMTGLWQVRGREHPSFRCYLRWDLFYVRHWCLLLDLRILYRTIFVVCRGTGI